MAKTRPGVMLYFKKVCPVIRRLSMAQRGELLTAVLAYAQDGSIGQMDSMTEIAFSAIQPEIDQDMISYIHKIHKNEYAAYCRECDRSGEARLPFADWEAWKYPETSDDDDRHHMTSDDINGHQPTSDDIGRYQPTSNTNTKPNTRTRTNTRTNLYNNKDNTVIDRGEGSAEDFDADSGESLDGFDAEAEARKIREAAFTQFLELYPGTADRQKAIAEWSKNCDSGIAPYKMIKEAKRLGIRVRQRDIQNVDPAELWLRQMRGEQ